MICIRLNLSSSVNQPTVGFSIGIASAHPYKVDFGRPRVLAAPVRFDPVLRDKAILTASILKVFFMSCLHFKIHFLFLKNATTTLQQGANEGGIE